MLKTGIRGIELTVLGFARLNVLNVESYVLAAVSDLLLSLKCGRIPVQTEPDGRSRLQIATLQLISSDCDALVHVQVPLSPSKCASVDPDH